ncbi:DUF6477 family protein [Paracoccus sediminicola]|uniref:DUF6477 family protein n=1 Tax=Paracoccus sediminicola TaxID=3017783 RepID=UPI0022F0037E|nr:DUF6477 family protein [Paracoccus sediminicola]WBU57815.1 DUF6477 family protein [Paracoccus sediminicola]
MSFIDDPRRFHIASVPLNDAPPEPGAVLRRPVCLIRAAKAGQGAWKRARDLPRVLRCETAPPRQAALIRLREAEAQIDAARRAGRAEYDPHRHILLLIALLAEITAAPESDAREITPMGAGRRRKPGLRVIAFSDPGTARPERRA